MELVLAVYVALVLIAVPMFRVEGMFGLDYAKDQLFAVLTGLALICSMFHGKLYFPSDQFILGFFAFTALSLFWCDHNHIGKREIVRLACTLAFVGMAAQLPKPYMILAGFLPAPVIAFHGIIQQIWKRDLFDKRFESTLRKGTRFFAWFGNSNHAAAYLAPQVFLGAWLAVNESMWFAIPTALVLTGVAVSKCRAAQLAVMAGVCALYPLLIPVAVLVGAVIYKFRPGCRESIGHRFLMTRAAIEIWKKYPIFGAGPRCFRHKHSRAVAELNITDETILGRPGKPGRFQFTVGRRAHNDYAETLAEYGLIGAVLAGCMVAAILWRVIPDGILFASAVAFLVNAGLFLNFRDTAVSLPFWLIVATTGIGTYMPVGLVPALLISAIAVYVMYLYHYKPFRANWETEHGGDSLKALMLQPYSSEYLTRIAKDALMQKQIGLAFNCAEKALYHYDGEMPEWSVLHNFGQIAAVNGALAVAKMSLEQALLINPSAKDVLESLKEVHRVIRQMRNENETRQKMAA